MRTFNNQIFFNSDFDTQENAKEYIITMRIDDLAEQKIKVEINDNCLTVSGHKQQQKEQATVNTSSQFKSFDSFSRVITLPGRVDINNIKTQTQDNTLIITLPKQ
ncbi:MAG: Hsp20/alpha crystallin family protein [Candidatus Omnitrophota bacterium]